MNFNQLVASCITGAFLFGASLGHTFAQSIAINEVLASNTNNIQDEDGDNEDWIELYNFGTTAVDLGGYGLSDDPDQPFRFTLPAITLPAGEFLLLWASGKNRPAPGFSGGTLVASGSVWKYHDLGQNLGTAWRQPGYDDSSWNSGSAPLGYGRSYVVTQVGFGPNPSNKYPATYFRRQFTAYNYGAQTITLRLMVDDGAVVYINGTEILRHNMPGGTINFNTFANVLVAETPDIVEFQVPASVLQQGLNTVAVSVHQFNSTSSDLGFDLQIVGAAMHTNFRVNASGEEVRLTRPNGELADAIPATALDPNVSYGRQPDGSGTWKYFYTPTPGASNGTGGLNALITAPEFSQSSGFYPSGFSLALSTPVEGAQIVYTTDGSEPLLENQTGVTYLYRNAYAQAPNQAPGPLLQQTYTSHTYNGPIALNDRSNEPNKLANISSTYDNAPNYFPSVPVRKGTVVRARVYVNGIAGPVGTHTYFISATGAFNHNMPVVSISTSEDNLFDREKGMYTAGVDYEAWKSANPGSWPNGGTQANYWRKGLSSERPAHLQYFVNGQPVIDQQIGIRMHGGWSRSWQNKSIRLYAKSEYDQKSTFEYKFFKDSDDASFKRLVLRNSGNDFNNTYIRDAVAHTAVKHLSFDTQEYQPTVVYVNGEYFGLLNLRERYDDKYINRVYGIPEDQLDMLTNDAEIDHGSNTHFLAMRNFIANNDMSIPSNYEYIKTQMDVENFMEYQMTQIYYNNTDWPGNNIKFFRKNNAQYEPNAPYGHDGRWRWLLFDTDFGLGLVGNHLNNTLNHATFPGGCCWPNPDWSTVILRKLLLNEEFKTQFVNRFLDLMNTTWLPSRMVSIIDELAAGIAAERPNHTQRWNVMQSWSNNVQNMRNFVNQRPNPQRGHLRNRFGYIRNYQLTLDVSDPAHGYVHINTIDILPSTVGVAQNPYPWMGVYLEGAPVTVTAVPMPGYIFAGWEGAVSGTEATFTADFTGSTYVKAIFIEDPNPSSTEEVLHYWHFNNAAGTLTTVLADSSIAGGAAITYPGTGAGFMDDVADGSSLNLAFGESPGKSLRVRNPSNSRSLLIQAPSTGYEQLTLRYVAKRTTNGAEVQTVSYRNSPTGPFTTVATFNLTEDYTLYTVDLSNAPGVNNNPSLAIRIEFSGPSAAGTSGNNRFDNITLSGFAGEFGSSDFHPLAQMPFQLNEWSPTAEAGTYPPYMQFHWSADPSAVDFNTLADAPAPYDCAYNLTSRPRINGLGSNGFSFISTGSPQFNDCAAGDADPLRYVGSATIAVNTSNVSAATMSWIARLVTTGSRVFAVRLQYRLGQSGPYTDLALPVVYSSAGKAAGDAQPFSISLPAEVLGQSEVYLRYVYYQVSGSSGNRPEIGIDNILIEVAAGPQPQLNVQPGAIQSFYTTETEASAAQSYTLSGSFLSPASGNIMVSTTAPFELSADGVNFATSVNIPYQSSSVSAALQVRISAGAQPGIYSASVSHSGGGPGPVSFGVTGEVGYAHTLQPGDIAIIGFRSVANDGLSVAAWTDIPNGTAIIFTDKAWDGTALLANENALVWVNNTGAALPAGTVFIIGGPAFGNGTGTSIGTIVSGELSGLSQNGDNLFALQGALQAPHWLYGLSYPTGWIESGTVTNSTSYLPPVLQAADRNTVINALNAEYDDTRNTLASFAEYRSLVHIPALWRSDADGVAFGGFNTTPFTLLTCAVSGGTVSSQSPRFNLCVGDGVANVVSLSVSGNTIPGRFGLVRQSDLAVIATNANGNFNMELYPAGAYFAGYVAVEELSALAGVQNINQLSGCFSLSNQLAISSVAVSGGTIVANGAISGCISTVSFGVSGALGSTFRWVLLNQNGTLVIAQNNTGNFDLSDLPNATYRLVHVASRGVNLASVTPPTLPDCVAASNQITVVKNCPSQPMVGPNPAEGHTYITFTAQVTGTAEAKLYDLSGRLVERLSSVEASEGEQMVWKVNTRHLPAGVYLLRIEQASAIHTERLVITK